VAKKDYYSTWTQKSMKEGENEISVPNLEVINLMKSLTSRGYTKMTFNWCVRPGWRASGAEALTRVHASASQAVLLLVPDARGCGVPEEVPAHPQGRAPLHARQERDPPGPARRGPRSVCHERV
jgi:hypothetical protein